MSSFGPGLVPAELWPAKLQSGVRRLRARGVDLIHAFSVSQVAAQFSEQPALFQGRRPGQIGLVLGNSRSLWPLFCGSPEAQSVVGLKGVAAANAHPLDRYVERIVLESLGQHLAPGGVEFGQLSGGRTLPLQRIATLAGLTHTGPGHLNLHPVYGTWIGLRGVLVLEASLSWQELALRDQQLARPQQIRCHTCTAPCAVAFERALEDSDEPARTVASAGEETSLWQLSPRSARWLRVRQVCPVGAEFAYGPRQSQYHYDKCLDAIGPEPPSLQREP